MAILNKKLIALSWKPEYYRGTLFMTLSNPIYNIAIPVNEFYISKPDTLPGYPNIITWNIPKPDILLMHEFICIATKVYKRMSSECLGLIIYNSIANIFKIVYPDQIVNGASVSYKPDEVKLDSNSIIVADVHSHHTMGISFSGVDDHDDNKMSIIPHISIVAKKIDAIDFTDLNKNIDCRLSIQGTRYNLKVNDVFDDGFERYYVDEVEKHFEKKYTEPSNIPITNELTPIDSLTPKIPQLKSNDNFFISLVREDLKYDDDDFEFDYGGSIHI